MTTDKSTRDAMAQVKAKVDKVNAQGFVGAETDSTDNAAYTVAGVNRGDPVPETTANPKAASRAAAGE